MLSGQSLRLTGLSMRSYNEEDVGKFCDIRAAVELISAYVREGLIRVLAWLKDTMIHDDVFEYALDKIYGAIVEKLVEAGLLKEVEKVVEVHFLMEDEVEEVEFR